MAEAAPAVASGHDGSADCVPGGHDKPWDGPQPWEKTRHKHRITPKNTDIFWRPHQVLFFWNDDHTVDSVDRKWLCPFLRKRNVGGRMKIGKNDLNDHIHQVFEMCSHLLSYITQAPAEIPHTSGMQAYTLQTIKHFFLSAGNTAIRSQVVYSKKQTSEQCSKPLLVAPDWWKRAFSQLRNPKSGCFTIARSVL